MMGENIDHHLAVFDPSARRDLMAQDDLLSVIVHERAEYELRALTRPIERPTCQTTRNFLYIFLSISAFYAKRMKLHDLTSIVFVNARLPTSSSGRNLRLGTLLLPLHFTVNLLVAIVGVVQARISESSETRSLLRCAPSHLVSIGHLRVGRCRLKVIQVDQHRRTFRRRKQQILKLAHRSGSDHVHLVVGC